MTNERIDPELLAAMLDGTTADAERTEILSRLARSKEQYTRFLEAAAVWRELDPRELDQREAAPVTVVPDGVPELVHATRGRSLRFVAPLLTLAAAITIVLLLQSRGAAPDVMQFAEAARLMGGPLSQQPGPAWDDRGWSVTRGSAPVHDRASHAFRAGVRMAQLTMAANAGDSAAVAREANYLGDLLADVDGASALIMRLAALAQQPQPDPVRTRLEMASQLRTLLGGADWFDLGVWTESAHMAARNGDLAFFAAGGVPLTTLTRLLARPVMPAEQWQRETRVLRALSAEGARERGELPAIDGMLTTVLAAAGG